MAPVIELVRALERLLPEPYLALLAIGIVCILVGLTFLVLSGDEGQSAHVAEGVPQASARVAEVTPQASARVAEGVPQASARVAEVTPQASARVAEMTPQASARVAEVTPQASVRAAEVVPQASARVAEVVPQALEASAPVLLSVRIEVRGEQCLIEVEGRRYAGLLDVPAALRPGVVRAIDSLVQFGLATPLGAPQTSAPAPQAAESDTSDEALSKPDVSARPITTRTLTPEEYAAARKRQERIRSLSFVASALIQGPPEPAVPAFFEEINKIIARRMKGDAQWKGRAIQIRTNLEGELEVIDGKQIFPSLDEVPDDLVRELVRAAIAEFQQEDDRPQG